MKARSYPTNSELVQGTAFRLATIKDLKKFFPKDARMEITYEPDNDGELDLDIWYQAKPRGRWREIGWIQKGLNFKWLPDGSGIPFMQWANNLYHEEVDVIDSKVDKLHQECFT